MVIPPNFTVNWPSITPLLVADAAFLMLTFSQFYRKLETTLSFVVKLA